MKDTENREKFKVYGELINTYGYNLEEGAKTLECLNYYTNEMVSIPMDPLKTPQENSQRYFAKYNKQKRTFEALSVLCKETLDEITYLESIQTALDIALTEDDLAEIKEELTNSGYIRRKYTKKKVKIKNKPLHYISSDGYHMYVGKNNLQNETFGICADRYKATDAQKAQIETKKKEIMKKVSEIGELEAVIDCEELRPYISPSYYETQSRESMIIRKMRNNVMKSIPKKWDNPVQAYEYNTMDATYREVQEEIEQHANKEEFIPEPMAIEEQPKQPTVAESVKTAEKEPVPAAVAEPEIPDFMKQEEM